MRKITATEAARHFSELLDSLERDGETVVVERRGRAVASISPAPAASGRALKDLLTAEGVDPEWAGELAALRASLSAEDRSWRD